MARASVEFGGMDFMTTAGSSLHAKCQFQEELAVGAGTVTGTAATAPQYAAANNALIARIAVDVDTYWAKGTTPDPTALASTAATSARRFISAGSSAEVKIEVGEKIAVKAA